MDNMLERLIRIEVQLVELQRQVVKINDERTWLTRLVIGLIITAIVGGIVIRNNA